VNGQPSTINECTLFCQVFRIQNQRGKYNRLFDIPILHFEIKETNFKFGYFTTISGFFFRQPHRYLSQTFGADGHFEVLNMSKSQLDKKLQHKTQIFLFQFFFNFGRKNPENL
jgi:hypothetical protein